MISGSRKKQFNCYFIFGLLARVAGLCVFLKFYHEHHVTHLFAWHSWLGISSLHSTPYYNLPCRNLMRPLLLKDFCIQSILILTYVISNVYMQGRTDTLTRFLLTLFTMHHSGTSMAAKTGSKLRLSATPVIMFAHFLAIAVTTLILVWLLNFREGVAFESTTKEKIFNLHPLLMAVGFVLVAGEAIMTYKTVPTERATQKIFQLILHCFALVAGTSGIYAVFKYHNELSVPDMNTVHSWIGMSTFCLFGLQFLLGFFSFMFPGANSGTRSRMAKWHMLIGIVILLMAVISAETGLAERFTFLSLPHDQDVPVMQFTVLLIILIGVAVDLRTRSRMVQVFVGIVIFLSATISAEISIVYVTPLTLLRRQEAVIMNFTGILILLFGVAVCVAVILPRPY